MLEIRCRIARSIETYGTLALLAPLDKAALVIAVGKQHVPEVDMPLKNALYDVFFREIVAPVQIYSPDQSLEGVAAEVLIGVIPAEIANYMAVETYAVRNFVEHGTTHHT
jgi:hypothetical protein